MINIIIIIILRIKPPARKSIDTIDKIKNLISPLQYELTTFREMIMSVYER